MALTDAGGCPPLVSVLNTSSAILPWTPTTSNQFTSLVAFVGAGNVPFPFATTNAWAFPANFPDDVKSHFGERPVPLATGFGTK